jgi:hypothetical protein
MNRIPEIIVIAGILLAMACLYMGATNQIDTVEMVVTTLASLFISVIAAIEERNLRD